LNTEAREVLGNVQNKCNGCQACSSACPLLAEPGGLTLPEIAGQAADGQPSKQARNFIQKCSLCGRCTRHCPSAVDVPAMVTAARTVLAESNPVSLELYRPVWVDYDWNIFTIYRDTYRVDYRDLVKKPVRTNDVRWREHGASSIEKAICPSQESEAFPLFHVKDKCETLFFPGCALSSYAPELTRASFDWLSERSGNVGLSLSCCGLPLVQMGAAERAAEYMATLRQSVTSTGARRIVTICPTCHCHLQGQPGLTGTEVVSLYQLMAEVGVRAPVSRHREEPRADQRRPLAGARGFFYGKSHLPLSGKRGILAFSRKMTIHDSCPERRVKLGGHMREILGNYDIVEMAHSGAETICCGSGGLVGIVDPASCSRQAELRMAEFRQVVAAQCVTYCINCALTLSAAAPGKVRHILELVFNRPVDYAAIQRRSEAMWQGEPGKVNLKRLENSSFQKY
jgi:fumarate reductase (CoM/CoB) subunit B